MSDPRPGDSSPGDGRDAALALISARLSEMGERIGGLTGRMRTAEAGIAGQAQAVAEAAGLASEVTRLSEAIARAAGPAAGEYPPSGHPRTPVWAAMDDELYVDSLRDLARWVAEILLARYPHARVALPPCWPAHPAAVEELDWLYWDWTCWSSDPEGRSRDAADWHDRWLPGVLARIGPQLAACTTDRGHVRPSYDRAVPRELNLSDAAPEQVFIENMRRASSSGGAAVELIVLGDRGAGGAA
jgi:hypothetical protein